MLYLAHSFEDRHMVRTWEQVLRKDYNVKILNPFYDSKHNVELMDKGFKTRYDVPLDVVHNDIELIKQCNPFVAIFTESFTIGTIMELVYASLHEKTRIVIGPKKITDHVWIKAHSDIRINSLDAFRDILVSNICLFCYGDGHIDVEHGDGKFTYDVCPTCDGSGKLLEE